MTRNPSDLIGSLALRMLVLAGAVIAVFFLLTSADAEVVQPPPVTHVVEPGDSLWDLAKSVAPDGADVRRVVDAIFELNQLEDAIIYPGQRILLPAS